MEISIEIWGYPEMISGFTLALAAILVLIIGVGGGLLLNYLFGRNRGLETGNRAEPTRLETVQTGESKIKELELDLKENYLKMKSDFEIQTQEKKTEWENRERRLQQREDSLDNKLDKLYQLEKEIAEKEKAILERDLKFKEEEEELRDLINQQKRRLETISHMTEEEAKADLKASILQETRLSSVGEMRRIEEEAKETANQKARKIIGLAIQRLAADEVAKSTVSVVDLPSDEMKGRIIGREGRNIRAMEQATGVDLIIDDTPGAVILSCFDPVKREIARIALQNLVEDGRIHPTRIEETVESVKKEFDQNLREIGERTLFELGLDGIHPDLTKLIGRLNYRTSYSQNILNHSKEVARLAGIMAGELKQDVKLAKRAALFHDIGKAIDQEVEGDHATIGIDLARKYNEPRVVINSIAAHHEIEPYESVISVLVAASDAISASRPGARREMVESYVKRLGQMEAIGDSFDGVEKTYAIQAGREIRVIVQPDSVGDDKAYLLAKDIAQRIQKEVTYPGEVKVTVIRETRASEMAH